MRHRLILCVLVLSLTLSAPTGLAASHRSPSHTSRWTAVSKGPKQSKHQWSRQTGATDGRHSGHRHRHIGRQRPSAVRRREYRVRSRFE